MILNVKKNGAKCEAFTLVEMIIAMTIFSVFIGFVLSTYISFHSAQEDAATTRNVLLEAENVMGLISDAIKEDFVNYDAYTSGREVSADVLSDFLRMSRPDVLTTNTLQLLDTDGNEVVFDWDAASQELTLRQGDGEARRIHSDEVGVKSLTFEIFPSDSPYDSENISDDDLQFQPIIKVYVTFSAPGRAVEEVDLSFETSVTSRFYQSASSGQSASSSS